MGTHNKKGRWAAKEIIPDRIVFKRLRELWSKKCIGLKVLTCAQNKTSEISKNALPGILGLLCAEQDVGNLKKCIFRNSGTHKTSEISNK